MLNEEEYYASPVIPVDVKQHNDSGFCYDMTHECHENPDSIADLQEAIVEGEATTEDANRIFRGQVV